MNLNKTILQSIYIIFRLFLLFACLKKFQRLNQITRDGLFLDDLQTINHMLETINHVLEKCEYETFIANKINITAKAPVFRVKIKN